MRSMFSHPSLLPVSSAMDGSLPMDGMVHMYIQYRHFCQTSIHSTPPTRICRFFLHGLNKEA